MSGNITISRSSNGDQVKDGLHGDLKGINHGEVTNNVTTLEEVFYISHDGVSPITDVILFIDDLSELIAWSDLTAGDGLLVDTNNDGNFDVNIKSGSGNSLIDSIFLGDINSGEEKVIRFKIKVPSSDVSVGVRNFNLNFNFDYTT
jgi:hypothetical protein